MIDEDSMVELPSLFFHLYGFDSDANIVAITGAAAALRAPLKRSSTSPKGRLDLRNSSK